MIPIYSTTVPYDIWISDHVLKHICTMAFCQKPEKYSRTSAAQISTAGIILLHNILVSKGDFKVVQ